MEDKSQNSQGKNNFQPEPAKVESAQPVVNSQQPAVPQFVPPVNNTNFAGSPQPAQKPKNNKLFKIILLVATVVLLFGAGGVLAYYQIMNNKPEKVLADAMVNSLTDILNKKPTKFAGMFSFETKSDQKFKISIKFDGQNSGENSTANTEAKINFAAYEYNIKTTAMVFGENEIYVKFGNVEETLDTVAKNSPLIATYVNEFKPVIQKIDNRWIKITNDDLKQLGSGERDLDKCTKSYNNLKFSKQDTKKLKQLFKENQFIIVSQQKANEKINGESSFHYIIDFNNQVTQKFFEQVIELPSMERVKQDCEINKSDFQQSAKKFEEQSNSAKPIFELWIGRKSRRPTKVSVKASNTEATLDFNSTIKLGASPIEFVRPNNTISIIELKRDVEARLSQFELN